MVVVNKGFLVFLFWGFASIASAEKDATSINEPQEDEIINFAYTQMKASVEELERKIDECDILTKNNTLSPALFQSLSLTKQEARIALGYFSSRAQEKCEDMGLWAKVTMEFAQFKYVEKYYKGKNIIKTENHFETICCVGSTNRLKMKWKYLRISPEIREKLERMPELKKPFSFIQTAKIMRLP
ncbi:MAG: hypothetical protein L3J88_12470 [Gammaproteobacteria bacterium]|nr:hypothetical protein [Gammaproteobacteria bacterium]